MGDLGAGLYIGAEKDFSQGDAEFGKGRSEDEVGCAALTHF